MHTRRWLVGLALSVVAAACAPNVETSTPPAFTGQTPDGVSQPALDNSAITSATSTTAVVDTSGDPVPSTPSPPPSDPASSPSNLLPGGPVPMGAPDVVADRPPLPYCGATLLFPNDGLNPFVEIEVSDNAIDCYRSRADSGLPAEMIEVSFTTEGDPILTIRRLLPNGREEFFSDSTRDAFGTQAWFRYVCPGYEEEGCEPSEELAPARLAPQEATLFKIATSAGDKGPPFYVTIEGVSAGRGDAWATHRITIVSEWRTPIAVLTPPTRYTLERRAGSRVSSNEVAIGESVVIGPGAHLSFLLELEPRLSTRPVAGTYEIAVPITYWRDVDAAAGPTGSPENTLIVEIRYQILDTRTASSIQAFCGEALAAVTDLAELDQERLTKGLDAIETAASQLWPWQRDELLVETARLRLQTELWFGPTPGHGGFNTEGVIWPINWLCGTDLSAMGVQA